MDKARETGAAPAPSGPIRLLRESTLLLAGGAFLGLAAIAVERQGAGQLRAPVVVLALLAGVAAALLPLRYGLALAVALSTLNGFVVDFGGAHAAYWNEVFAAIFVLRSALKRLPSRTELFVAAAIVAVWGAYVLAGYSVTAASWGLKVLVLSPVVGWSVARLGVGRREWHGVFSGLAVGVAANLTLAAWQRAQGLAALERLGFPPERVGTKVGHDVVRAFGGGTSSASFSFVLVIAAFCWLAFLMSGRRNLATAVSTAWIPLAVVVGLSWAVDRTALLALTATGLVVGVRHARHARILPFLLVVGFLGVGVVALGSSQSRSVLRKPFSVGSAETRFRVSLWRAYLDEFSVGGAGPASAGSAYFHVHKQPPRRLPIYTSGTLDQRYTYSGAGYRWFSARRALIFIRPPAGRHGPLRFQARVTSYGVPRRLTVQTYVTRRIVRRLSIPADRFVALTFPVPPGRGLVRFIVEARPPPQRATGGELGHQFVSWQLRDPRLDGLPPPRTAAERAYEKRLDPFTAPGVVDNEYVTWAFEYGLAGIVLCLVFVAALLYPLTRPLRESSRLLAAALVGTFLVFACLGVDAWEEAPTDLIASLVLAHFVAVNRPGGSKSQARS